jgi:hypothetical protein
MIVTDSTLNIITFLSKAPQKYILFLFIIFKIVFKITNKENHN